VGSDEEQSLQKKKLHRREEFLAPILDAATRINKLGDQLRQTTRDLRTRVAKFNEVVVAMTNNVH
jgi:hypothetical protein